MIIPPVEEMSGPTRALAEAAAEAAAYGRRATPPPSGTPERAALIREAMGHWAKGHAIFERLDPKVRESVRVVAEQLAPK